MIPAGGPTRFANNPSRAASHPEKKTMNTVLPPMPVPPMPVPPMPIPPEVPDPNKLRLDGDGEVRETFQEVLGELLFGQMLKAMRKTVGKPAYFHGGRGEDIFTQQLDQILSQKMAEADGDRFIGPMYNLYELQALGRR